MGLFGDMVWVFLGTSRNCMFPDQFTPPRKLRKLGNGMILIWRSVSERPLWRCFLTFLSFPGFLTYLTYWLPRGIARGRKQNDSHLVIDYV